MTGGRRTADVAARHSFAVPAWCAPIAVLLAALVLHADALRAGFFADDWAFLDATRGRGLGRALLAPDPLGNYVRPLSRTVWFALVDRLGGGSPMVFHLANLALLLVAILTVWAIARRLAGERAAAIAAGILALTYAADVPVRWVSGVQDLLAVALALGACWAATRGRVAWAALGLALAPFAKETVALACVPVVLLLHRPGASARETWRRAWPCLVAPLVYASCAALVLAHRAVPGAGLALVREGPLAALAGLVRVSLGLEWASGGAPFRPFAWPTAGSAWAIALAVLAVACTPGDERTSTRAPGAWRIGALLALVGALPVMAVAPLWSAYYFLFAMAGVALLAGTVSARAPHVVAMLIVVVAGLCAQQGRALEEFATASGAWTAQSHVNRAYLDRGMHAAEAGLAQIRQACPRMAPRTTVLMNGVPAWSALQTADGPLLRCAYRDTSLRSYYLSQLEPAMFARGPVVLLYRSETDTVFSDRSADPVAWAVVGYSLMLGGSFAGADTALGVALSRSPSDHDARESRIWTSLAIGARDRAEHDARLLGRSFSEDVSRDCAAARTRLASGDTTGALVLLLNAKARAVGSAELHGLLADLLFLRPDAQPIAQLESIAARVLAPGDPYVWRRLGYAQMVAGQDGAALRSFERYFALAPVAESGDEQARQWRELERARAPGSAAAQQAVRSTL